MPAPRLDLDVVARTVEAVQRVGQRAAAEELGIPYATIRSRLRRASEAAMEQSAPVIEPAPVLEPALERRLRDKLAQAIKERDAALKAQNLAEDLRSSVFGLTNPPLEPVTFGATTAQADRETIVVFLSDTHWGESISLAAMDGLNSYTPEIARSRLKRTFQGIISLATTHWSGPKPERLILILGGDMITGEIHAELAKTNHLKAIPAVRDLVAHLEAGIRLLLEHLECPIDIISLAGNHGRSTMKPEAKETVETSYDTLVSDFLSMMLANEPRVNFFVPPSIDALFSVYGWRIVATHGDRIGSRGGAGFIGPAATAARGMKRITMDYAARGVHLDLILIGHFHTALQLEEGFVNGCLIGPSEYSRDGRFRPKPASQLFLTIHPRRFVSQVRWLQPGHPSEGSLYEAPEIDRPIRPRYRVPAISRSAA
jgi:hypothetical protein